MMLKILGEFFFKRPTLIVAQELLGKFLVRKINGKKYAFVITEVEAYDGPKDRASHASRGLTPRNTPMFGEPGRWYVYFTYGIHWLANIVTGPKNYPAAVLIRAVCNDKTHLHGPAKLTKFLKIDSRLNTKEASRVSGLWLEDRGVKIPKNKIKKSPRIGVDRAGPIWAKKNYRFYLECE